MRFTDERAWWRALGGESGAREYDDGTYRTLLWRAWLDDAPPFTYCMLNPSTANADEDDATIRRCTGIARAFGAGGIVVVNLSPYRATDPKDWVAAEERDDVDVWLAEHNREAMDVAIRIGRRILCAWGGSSRPSMAKSAATFAELAAIHGKQLECFGYTVGTRGGQPRHPLMLTHPIEIQPFMGWS